MQWKELGKPRTELQLHSLPPMIFRSLKPNGGWSLTPESFGACFLTCKLGLVSFGSQF